MNSFSNRHVAITLSPLKLEVRCERPIGWSPKSEAANNYWQYFIHTNHSGFVLERVTEPSQIFLRNTHILPKRLSEELDDRAVSALRRAIAEVKQGWSVIGWVTKYLLSLAPSCFGRHVKPLVPATFAVVSTYQSTLGPRGSFSLCVSHKEGLCPSSGGTFNMH
jgi:hypothetical protein